MYNLNRIKNYKKRNEKFINFNFSKELFLKKEKFSKSELNKSIKTIPFTSILSLGTVRDLAFRNQEIKEILTLRLKGLLSWKFTSIPKWTNLSFALPWSEDIYFSNYSIDVKKNYKLIGNFFNDLGLKSHEYPIDAVYNSNSMYVSDEIYIRKVGILFTSISQAISLYPNLIKEYFGSVVPMNDNNSAALNFSIFSDGSFIYAPINIKCDVELTTYFRLDNEHLSQFERTLIIGEKNSFLEYFEGCSSKNDAPIKNHAAVVELKALENTELIYTTIQDWSTGNKDEIGGINNLVTKRAICQEKNSKVRWTQVELGSTITCKYPSCILIGENSYGDFYSITLTDNEQQADTGTKIIHKGKGTKSRIISKGITRHFSETCFRSLVNHLNIDSYTYSQCDSLMLTQDGLTLTLPSFKSVNGNFIEHEATICRLSDERLFYFYQRNIPYKKAITLITNGFCSSVANRLPKQLGEDVYVYLEKKFKSIE